jgi:hypothetical protein
MARVDTLPALVAEALGWLTGLHRLPEAPLHGADSWRGLQFRQTYGRGYFCFTKLPFSRVGTRT